VRSLAAKLTARDVRAAYHRRRGAVESAVARWTGRDRPRCVVCGSARVVIEETGMGLIFKPPPGLRPWVRELRRRDNGRCLECGLEQAFHRFSEAGRRAVYAEPFESLGTDDGILRYPYDPAWVAARNAQQFGRRLGPWEAFLAARGVTRLGRVLQVRCDLGAALEHFHRRWGAEVYGVELVEHFRRHVAEHLPFIRQLPGTLAGKIEVDAGGLTFDLIVCFHTLTHSVDPLHDLARLRALLAPGGYVIFCDEISGKAHNMFHQVHFSEDTFRAVVGRYFRSLVRLRTGSDARFVAERTTEGDNPDWVGFDHE
jgi:SAM-dependent methyltransferase